MSQASWLMTQIRGLFVSINYCIYSLFKWIIQGAFDLANITSNFTLVEEMRSRIYVLLGIFMIFKISISLINYMINPDALADKEKGAGKLVARVVTSLALLIMLPFVFERLQTAQEVFLPVLPKIILGKNVTKDKDVNKSAEDMAIATMRAFYRPCDACETEVDEIYSLDDMYSTYSDAANRDITRTVNGEEKKESKKVYDYEFNYVFALIVGIIMVLILVGITVSIAIRVFKLLILEMLAPIPIISYIDPKSSKNGAFASWVKQVALTFLDIFIKIGLLYVIIYLISKLFSTGTDALFDFGNMKKSSLQYKYLQVFIIIGLLMFAKDAPKFIKDALGLKESNKGFLEGILGATSGAAAGAVSGAISGRGITGAATGMLAGASAGYQGGISGKKSNAWGAGGDAAIKVRTGDSNAKSGILAALSSSAARSQGRRQAARYGITEESLAVADMDVKSKEAYAQMKEMEYNEAVNRGTATAAMRQEVINAKMAAGKASSKYKKAEAAYEKFTGGESMRSKYVATRKSAAKDREAIDVALAIDRKRKNAAGPGATPGVDYATLTDPNKTPGQLYDDVDQRRSLGEAASDLFKDPMDKSRNDKNFNYPS